MGFNVRFLQVLITTPIIWAVMHSVIQRTDSVGVETSKQRRGGTYNASFTCSVACNLIWRGKSALRLITVSQTEQVTGFFATAGLAADEVMGGSDMEGGGIGQMRQRGEYNWGCCNGRNWSGAPSNEDNLPWN